MFSAKKTILLFLISIASLTLFFLIPKNQEWYKNRIATYWNDFRKNKNNLDPEHRKIMRWEGDYVYAKMITSKVMFGRNSTEDQVLIPPSQYFVDHKINFHVPEPAVFYYYTGLKTVWINSKKAQGARWIVTVKDSSLFILRVSNPKMLDDSIQSFRKYPVKL